MPRQKQWQEMPSSTSFLPRNCTCSPQMIISPQWPIRLSFSRAEDGAKMETPAYTEPSIQPWEQITLLSHIPRPPHPIQFLANANLRAWRRPSYLRDNPAIHNTSVQLNSVLDLCSRSIAVLNIWLPLQTVTRILKEKCQESIKLNIYLKKGNSNVIATGWIMTALYNEGYDPQPVSGGEKV